MLISTSGKGIQRDTKKNLVRQPHNLTTENLLSYFCQQKFLHKKATEKWHTTLPKSLSSLIYSYNTSGVGGKGTMGTDFISINCWVKKGTYAHFG